MGINKVGGIVGRRGCGKTTYVREKIILPYRQLKPKNKVLIVDTLDHPAYRDVPEINLSQLKRWKGANMYRIYGSETDEIFKAIASNLANAIVIFEDASKYIPSYSKLDPYVRKFIVDSKQRNLDVLFLFHGYSHVCPELFSWLDFITIFKTLDTPEVRLKYIPYFLEMNAIYEHVNESDDAYIHKTLLTA